MSQDPLADVLSEDIEVKEKTKQERFNDHIKFILEEAYVFRDDETLKELQDALWNEYTREGRSYHTVDHILYGLDSIRRVKIDEFLFLWAFTFHDFVYDPKQHDSDNVQASVDAAIQWLEKIADKKGSCTTEFQTNRLTELIKVTDYSRKEPLDDIKHCLMHDFDLSYGLSMTPEEVEKCIRDEFSFVEEPVYRLRRIKVLVDFVKKQHIFQSWIFEDLEEKIRESMEVQLAFNLKRLEELVTA